MKTKALFSAESNAKNFLICVFFGLAIYLKIQIILFVIDYFHQIDFNTTVAGLI